MKGWIYILEENDTKRWFQVSNITAVQTDKVRGGSYISVIGSDEPWSCDATVDRVMTAIRDAQNQNEVKV